jgi:A/G-specific adenine glycosylase
LRRRLQRWYRKHQRDLPWRLSNDPYAVWVSEIMLQQTRVATVVPYYASFLKRFPNVRTLAAAKEETVLAAWSGLGYYRRARQLHKAARVLLEEHEGRLPETLEELLRLPGIGRYTAGAIASIAFDVRAPILDGNVKRVLARLHGLKNPTERNLWSLAGSFADGPHPGEINQALMELGALVCHAKAPECTRCPWKNDCKAHAQGIEESCPAPVARPTTVRVDVVTLWIVRGGRLLLQRRAASAPLRGSWDVPGFETNGASPPDAAQLWAAAYNLEIRTQKPGPGIAHHILNRRLTLIPLKSRLLRGRVHDNPDLRWAALDELTQIALSGATWKLVQHHDPLTAARRNG